MTPAQQAFLNLESCLSCHYTETTAFSRASLPEELATGAEDADVFDPGLRFDWKWWMQAAMKLRVRSVMGMSKHVGGFPMWRSTVTTRSIATNAWGLATGRDIFGEFCSYADRLFPMKGVYFPVGDSALFELCGETFNATYINTTLAQLTEVFGGDYGNFGYAFLDAWGLPPWGNGSAPDFTDIPAATIVDHIKSLQPNCQLIINSHSDDYGDLRLWEVPYEGESKGPIDHPIAWHCPIESTQKWFNPYDRPFEPIEPAASSAIARQERAALQNAVMIHNISPRMDGKLDDDQLAIIDKISAVATIPRLWRGIAFHWDFDETSTTDNATEKLQGYNLTELNSPSVTDNPLLGIGRTLNGTNQRFKRAADGTLLGIGLRSVSIAMRAVAHSLSGFPTLFSKSTTGLIEYEWFLESGVPTWRISRDGAAYNDLASSDGALTIDEPFSCMVTYDIVLKRMSIQMNGGTVDYDDWEPGIADSVEDFVVGALTNATRFWNGTIYSLSVFLDVVKTEQDGIDYHNGGKQLALYETVPVRDGSTLIRRIKVRNSDGTPATGLGTSDFSASYNVTGSKYISLQLEDASSFPGVYTQPSTAGHICIIEVDSTDNPVKGIYEVHFHNAQFGSNDILWLYMASDGKIIDPLEVHINNNVTHISGVPQTGADVSSLTFNAATQSTAANAAVADLPTAAENAAALLATDNSGDTVAEQLASTVTLSPDDITDIADAVADQVGGGTSISPINVGQDHEWSFDTPSQMTAPKIISENLGFANALVAMNFSGTMPPRSAINTIDAVVVLNSAGTEPTVVTSERDTELKKAIITLDTTAATAGTYTCKVTITTTDSQTIVRYGALKLS